MQRYMYIFVSVLVSALAFAHRALAASSESGDVGAVLFIKLITIVVVGGIIYNLVVSFSGFGGMLGNAIKLTVTGVFVLSLETIDSVIEGITGYGSENIFGKTFLHDVVHDVIVLAGFLILAWGLSRLTKTIRTIKGGA